MDLREQPTTLTTRHPWETVRAEFYCRVLADPRAVRAPISLVDLGAGDGFVADQLLRALPAGSSVTCVDAEYTDDHLAKLARTATRGLSFTRSCPDREFDAAVLLDVLEHIADDRGFLRQFVAQRLRPGGLLLASVPAHQTLFTQHDVALGHHRRYSARELRDLLSSVGLVPWRWGRLFGSGILARGFDKLVERLRGIDSQPSSAPLASQISTGITAWPHGPVVTGLVRGMLTIDARLCELAARWSAPSVGLSVWALCKRER
jgi:SAM-dependent methyltransferase